MELVKLLRLYSSGARAIAASENIRDGIRMGVVLRRRSCVKTPALVALHVLAWDTHRHPPSAPMFSKSLALVVVRDRRFAGRTGGSNRSRPDRRRPLASMPFELDFHLNNRDEMQ